MTAFIRKAISIRKQKARKDKFQKIAKVLVSRRRRVSLPKAKAEAKIKSQMFPKQKSEKYCKCILNMQWTICPANRKQ